MKPNLAPVIGGPAADEWSSFGASLRAFDGPKWRIAHSSDRHADIVVSVIGLRSANGRSRREIVIDGPTTPVITPAEARELASALIAAAATADE
jgi:hypothetical protein